MAFFTIHAAPRLSPADGERARRQGPRFVNARSDYESMLRAAGFKRIVAVDVTGEFRRIQARWIRARERHRDAVIAAVGEARFREITADSRGSQRGIEQGLLRRSLFVATA
jgi:hypothetical protein